MESMPLNLLLLSLTFFVFLLCCSIVGVLMYRLGLNGRITRMMEDAEQAKASVKAEKEPTVIPGEEYNPLIYGHQPRHDTHWSYKEDDIGDEEEEDTRFITDEELNDQEFEDDPILPGPNKHKVVMTGGG